EGERKPSGGRRHRGGEGVCERGVPDGGAPRTPDLRRHRLLRGAPAAPAAQANPRRQPRLRQRRRASGSHRVRHRIASVKLSVEFPSVAYREGPAAVARMARAIEQIGYDHIDVFDHVVMGYPIAGRPRGPYAPTMPILEALMTLSYVAAVTTRVTLGTEVLVLPQRHPTLVAKQVSTLDTLSGGRVRLGVGVGWQESEYEALGENFATRGARMDEAIALLRAWWSESQVDFAGPRYPVTAMAMEPKPPQGRRLPIWIGGGSERPGRRVGRRGDGRCGGHV